MNIQLAEDLLLSTKSAFDSLKIPFWLHYGTLLVAVRDGEFKSDDGDVDVMIRAKDWDDSMFAAFAASGLRRFHVARFQGKTAIMYLAKEGNLTIDVHLQFHDPISKNYFVPPPVRYNDGLGTLHHVLPEEYLDRENYVSFLGVNFRIPWNAEEFLADIYGDWKKPMGLHEWRRFLNKQTALVLNKDGGFSQVRI